MALDWKTFCSTFADDTGIVLIDFVCVWVWVYVCVLLVVLDLTRNYMHIRTTRTQTLHPELTQSQIYNTH